MYPKSPCPDPDVRCKCTISSVNDYDCPAFVDELLSLRLVCKDYAIVIKQIVFGTVETVLEHDIWVSSERRNNIAQMLDSVDGDGGVTIRNCIRRVKWSHSVHPTLNSNEIAEGYTLTNLPNLTSLSLVSCHQDARSWSDDLAMTVFVGHFIRLNVLSTISISHIDNVPIHTLLAQHALLTLTLKHVTFAPRSSDPMNVNHDVRYNLRNLTSIGRGTPFLALLRYVPKLTCLSIDITPHDPHEPTPYVLDHEEEWEIHEPHEWAMLEELKFRGDLDMFHHIFKVEEASRADINLFPALVTLEVKDEPSMKPVAQVQDVYAFDDWVGNYHSDSDSINASLDMKNLRKVVIDQSSCAFLFLSSLDLDASRRALKTRVREVNRLTLFLPSSE
ncbi:hypothetical protein CVT24_004611 [Panaeolus cyanescens]|uniref:Uncharacterized protein n=1 Tax=Panaeolus cyanescens TaxID=181874 RepID=A0A409YBD8_9AGAR|nr:hypothetical protein CVT24_004611 [Panaeolus cyanescens]